MGSRGEERRILNVEVYDVQKRRRPSKHYVYIIKVTWSPKTVNVIYRRYSRFFDFQNSLLEKFPLESGQLDPSQRIIPFLPGKIYFGRSQVRDVALKRLSQIDDYCKSLLSLDERISQCEEVQDFFSVEEDDVNPPTEDERKKKANFDTASKISEPRLGEQYRAIADYTKEDKWDLNLKAGTEVEVIEKTESVNNDPVEESDIFARHVDIVLYENDGHSLTEDDDVFWYENDSSEQCHTCDNGWWFVHVQDQQGWVPSTYLKRADGVKEEHGERARPGEEEKYICSEDYYPANPDELALTKGTLVEVVEKNLDGWWWVRQNGNEGWAPATYMMKAEKAHMERVARASGVQIVGKLEDISDLMQEDGDESWDDEPDPPPRPSKPYLSKKSRSLERGGSIRPPPRQNSIKNIKVDLKPLKEKTFQYVTIADFVDTVGDGISFSKGDNVEVKEKTSDGWWFVKIGNREGWAPSTYIESKEIEAIPEDNHVSNVNYDANYSEVAMDSDEEQYEFPEPTPVHSTEYEEVNYEVPINVAGEGEKPKFAFSEPKNKPEPEIVTERPCSVQVELRLKKMQNAAIKRPTSKPPPPPTAVVTNKDNMPGPPHIDRSSLATALKNKLGSKAMEDIIKPDLEAQSSNSSSDSEKRPNLPPKLPAKPDFSLRNSTANLGMPKVPRERIHSDGGNNLAEVLKAKFESRKTTAEDSGNTDDPIFNTFPKKSGVQISQLPISQTKSDPDFSNKKVGGKPALLPKFDKPVNHLRPSNKNDVGQKRFSMQEEGSELANALQARLRRQSNIEVPSSQHYSAVEKPKKSFPLKPIIPEKTISEEKRPIVPPKLQGKKTEAKENSVASAMKSKFESRSGTGWKKESSKPKSKPPVLAKPKKPQLQKQDAKNVVQTETKGESPTKSGFAKELASKLSSNINKQDTNCEAKPPIPKKSPIVQKVYGSKVDNNVKEKEIAPLKSSAQTYRSLAKYQAEGNGEISFEEGVQMEVLEKTEGWWLVRVGTSEGWAPVTYIEPCGVGLRSPSPVCDSGFTSPEEGSNSVTSVKYRTCAEFVPESETELGFIEGLIVEVLDASEDDWWYARVDGREGWVPAEYLEEV